MVTMVNPRRTFGKDTKRGALAQLLRIQGALFGVHVSEYS